MLLYICTCLVLLGVGKSAQVNPIEPTIIKPNNDAPKQADAIFADVIKNISRVNNVLQELINNYEQLQKIYKSQETVDSVYSDSEIDELFKNKNGKQLKRTKDREGATKKPHSLKLATQMFWSDHDDNEENDDSNNDDTKEVNEEKNKVEANKKDILEPKQDSPVTRKTTTLKPVTSEESSDDSSDTSFSLEKVKKHKKDIAKTPAVNKLTNPPKPKPAEIIFVDTHKKSKTIDRISPTNVKTKPKVESAISFVGLPTKPKTRYSKVSHNKATNPKPQAQNLIPNANINDTRKVKKIMYAESFAPKKIWNDIINNKPIQLEAHNEITLRRIEKAKRNKTLYQKRSQKGKAAVVIITNNKKKTNQGIVSSDDDDLTNKEELKTNVLRQAYGDACLKLVLRKCHKACKMVSKISCNRVKCKSSARSAFKSYAKTGCIKEFQGEGKIENKETNRFSEDPVIINRGQDRNFIDMTRGGFLSAACMPDVTDHKKLALRNETDQDQNYNILRDRFERACKKISSNKCNNACKYAYTNMCETNECSKRMKKVFMKNCKPQCKRAYQLNDKDSDDSDSDDDDDDSDSDDDSDADSSSD